MRDKIFIMLKRFIIEGGLGFNEDDIEKLDGNASLMDLGVNSISFIKAVVAIEKVFGIKFSNDNLEVRRFKTINDLIDVIEWELKENNK